MRPAPRGARGRTRVDRSTRPTAHDRPQDRGVQPRAAPAGRRPGRAPSSWRSSRRSGARSRPRRRSSPPSRPSSRHGRWTTSSPPTSSPTPSQRQPARAARRASRRRRRPPAAARCRGRAGTRPTGRPAGRPRPGTRSRPPRRAPDDDADQPGLGRDRRLAERASHAPATGTRTRHDAATMPTVAVRSGSPAVLSRMFHAACRTAAMAMKTRAAGPRRESRSRRRRGRPAPARCRRAQRWTSRRAIPHAPSSRPPTASTATQRHARPVPQPDHRLAEVGGQRELVDPVRQLERGHDEVDEEREDHEQRDDLARERVRNTPPTAIPMPASASAYSPRTSVPSDRRRDVAAGDRRADARCRS